MTDLRYVAMVCFKHGPPRLLGVELEWTVHHATIPVVPWTQTCRTLPLGSTHRRRSTSTTSRSICRPAS